MRRGNMRLLKQGNELHVRGWIRNTDSRNVQGELEWEADCVAAMKIWLQKTGSILLWILTSKRMLAHAFTWSKTKKNAWKLSKVLFLSYARETHVRLMQEHCHYLNVFEFCKNNSWSKIGWILNVPLELKMVNIGPLLYFLQVKITCLIRFTCFRFVVSRTISFRRKSPGLMDRTKRLKSQRFMF